MVIDKVLFIGSKSLGFKSLQAIYESNKESLLGVLTFDDSNDVRSCFIEYQNFCNQKNIPLYIAKNRADSEQIISALKPLMAIVIGWYWIINNDIVKSIPYKMIGIHNSLLPQYRGMSPLVWSLINDEKKIGYSVFELIDKMDEGDLLYQKEIDFDDSDDVNTILQKIDDDVVTFFKENYLKILKNELQYKKQEIAQNLSYCATRNPEDGLINWNKSAREVFSFIRALTKPYPGAFTILNNEKLIIWDAVEIKDTTFYGSPGQIYAVTPTGAIIICGNHKAIKVNKIKFQEQEIDSFRILKTSMRF